MCASGNDGFLCLKFSKGISETSSTMGLLLVKLESNQEHQQKEIDKLRAI